METLFWQRPAVDFPRLQYKRCACGNSALREFCETKQSEPTYMQVWVARCTDCQQSHLGTSVNPNA